MERRRVFSGIPRKYFLLCMPVEATTGTGRRRRRGKRGLAVQFYFTGFIQNEEIFHTDIIFQINDVSQKEFEMAIEKIEYLVDAVSAELVKVQQEMTSQVTYAYDPLRRKWLLEPRRIGFEANRGELGGRK